MTRCILALIAALAMPGIAWGQSTATPVVPGYYCQKGATGCPSSGFVQYGASGSGGTGIPVVPGATTPVAGAQYALAVASATALTVPAAALVANVTVETQPIRCTTDGTTPPTSSVGALYQPGSLIQVWGTALTNFKCIQTTASATIDAEYFK